MGNSCLEYKGKHKFVDDFEIVVVALAMANFTYKSNEVSEVPAFASEWRQGLKE